MSSEESKPAQTAAQEADAELRGNQMELTPAAAIDDDDNDGDDVDASRARGDKAGINKSKKNKSKRKKVKELLRRGSGDGENSGGNMAESDIKKAISGLTPQQTKKLLALNPSLENELAQAAGSASPTAEKTADLLNKMKLQDIMTGLAASGKNVKDMGAYKFWQTQPVPRFGEEEKVVEEGPLRIQEVEEISTEPQPLVAGFEWVTMDLGSDEEIKEVYELLNGHYVEDDEANFRFSYSPAILRWAMMAPGWQRKYHIGVRASQSRKLVAFISAIPVHLRVRDRTFVCSEVNFLCVHKKLRGKRLAPVLIKEVTRISNLDGVWQGLYTAGIVLPKPVSTCRYYHRSINWQKLHECGFSPLPAGSKLQYQIRKHALPDRTATQGLRAMREHDVEAVADLMKRYSARFDLAPELTCEEAHHWFLPKENGQQAIWTYVVEDDKKITDFFSFFSIDSSVINNSKHDRIRVAYLFYYASETGLRQPPDQAGLKKRLNELINDALILARNHKFDVVNALSLMDNALFLEQQKFGAGDGQLHYYFFNYRMNHVGGGVDKRNQLDVERCSGIGLVMP